MKAHEIDYDIYGKEMQYVEIELDPQEAVVAEAGSFMMMDQGLKMFWAVSATCWMATIDSKN